MRAAVAMANRRSALLRFRQKREARTFDKKVRFADAGQRSLTHVQQLSAGFCMVTELTGAPAGLQVRYASRKRLAEARPRVRGQFVKAEVAAAFLAQQVPLPSAPSSVPCF